MSAGAQARGQAIAALRSLETIRLDGLRFRLVDARGMVGTLLHWPPSLAEQPIHADPFTSSCCLLRCCRL